MFTLKYSASERAYRVVFPTGRHGKPILNWCPTSFGPEAARISLHIRVTAEGNHSPGELLDSSLDDWSRRRRPAPRPGEIRKAAQVIRAGNLPRQFLQQPHAQWRVTLKSLLQGVDRQQEDRARSLRHERVGVNSVAQR